MASMTMSMSDRDPPSPEKISAYYSLVFPSVTFYVRTLSVTIGRRCNPPPPTATAAAASSASIEQPPGSSQVDVDLGALKSVSRLHAKIEYDQEEDRFVLLVIGRNGAWVDGVWSASGTHAPLGERSQIQIASRIFHFVLPPPPPPEDTPSPSSQSSSNPSNNRPRSPSLDITSISPPSTPPSHSPPPAQVKLPPPPPEPQLPLPSSSSNDPYTLPSSHSIKQQTPNPKKRKKADKSRPQAPPEVPVKPKLKPEELPVKPSFTYAQLIYRAIKALGGKATLQEICNWIMATFEYYEYADGAAWMSSVRHNLSSGKAFKKMERCGGDRGKGFFWSLEEKYEKTFEEQDAKAQSAAASAAETTPATGGKGTKTKKALEPPLKRSVRPLGGTGTGNATTKTTLAATASTSGAATTSNTTPTTATTTTSTPPTTTQSTTPAPTMTLTPGVAPSMQATTGVFAYGGQNPYAALTQGRWAMPAGSLPTPTIPAMTSSASIPPGPATTALPTSTSPATPTSATQPPPQPQAQLPSSTAASTSTAAAAQPLPLVPDVSIPIVIAPIPPTHPEHSPQHPPNYSAKEGYMVLHERTLILDPVIFSGLDGAMLKELERMGARRAVGVLTGHMVRVLKERKRLKEGDKGKRGGEKEKGKGKPKRKKGAGVAGGPFTTEPLPRRGGVGIAVGAGATAGGDKPPTAVSPSADSQSKSEEQDDNTVVIVVDDSDREAPAAKRRKVDPPPPVVAAPQPETLPSPMVVS